MKMQLVGIWAAMTLSACFFVFVAWDQSFWWRTNEEYAFGWLVPALVIFVVQARWKSLTNILGKCAISDEGSNIVSSIWIRLAAALALLFGSLLFALGALARARNGPSHLGTLAITLGAASVAFALLFFCAPSSADGRWNDRKRLGLLGLFLFPVGIWLISAPLVAVLDTPLRLWLLHWIVISASFFFRVMHLQIVRHGNVFTAPSGDIAVAEACIGIRSLTGSCVAALFLGSAFLKSWRKPVLFAVAVGLALATNLLRVLFLNLWAYRHGPNSIDGLVHDLAGDIEIALTMVILLLLVARLGRPRRGAGLPGRSLI